MLVRLSDPSYQIDLLIFLRNSRIFAVERADTDTVRVFEADEEHLREVVDAWNRFRPQATCTIVDEST